MIRRNGVRPLVVLLLAAGCNGFYVMPEAKVKLPGYRVCSPFSEGLAVLQSSDHLRYGYVDVKGAIVIPPRFFEAADFSEGVAAVQEDAGDRFGFIDRHGHMRIAPTFDAALAFSEGFAPVRLGDKWGFIDASGSLRIPAQYDNVWGFSQGLARATVDGLTGFVDATGRWAVPPSLYKAGDMRQGLAFVCDGSRCGFIDTTGSTAIGLQFDDAGSFSSGLAPVRVGDAWGYVDQTGNLAMEPRYTQADEFSQGLARVGIVKDASWDRTFGGYSGRATFWGFIDSTGATVYESEILGATPFTEGFSVIRLPSGGLCSDCYHYRLMARDGSFLPGRFETASPMKNGTAVVRVGEHSYVIDRTGSPLIELDQSYLRDTAESSRRIHRLNFGYIDSSGAVAIPHAYVTTQPFSEGLAFVEGRWERRFRLRGYIDRQGAIAIEIPDSISQALPFTEGRALVSTYMDGHRRYGFIDRTGTMVIAAQYGDAAPFSDGMAAVKFSRDLGANDWGYIDHAGAVVIPPRFRAAGSFSGGLAYVESVTEESYLVGAVIDRHGTVVADAPFVLELSRSLFGTPSLEQYYQRRRYTFGHGLIPKLDATTRGWIDSTGSLAIAGQGFDYLGMFAEGRAAVFLSDRGIDPGGWGFVDTAGSLVVPTRFASVEPFSEGLACVKDRAGRTGFVTRSGDWAIPPLWLEDARPFSDDRALVQLGGLWGYLDPSGRAVIPPRYPRAEPFSEGLAVTAVPAGRSTSVR